MRTGPFCVEIEEVLLVKEDFTGVGLVQTESAFAIGWVDLLQRDGLMVTKFMGETEERFRSIDGDRVVSVIGEPGLVVRRVYKGHERSHCGLTVGVRGMVICKKTPRTSPGLYELGAVPEALDEHAEHNEAGGTGRDAPYGSAGTSGWPGLIYRMIEHSRPRWSR